MSRRPRGEVVSQETRDSVTRLLTGVSRGDLSRREFIVRATALGISLSSVGMLLAACGTKDDKAAAPTLSTELPKELLIYNWAEYMAPGAITAFEKKTGVKCVEKFFSSNEELTKKMEEGAVYDVVFPSDAWVASLSSAKLLQPLDMSLLPNFSYVLQPVFVKPAFDNESDGHKYSVPYMFGTTGFCANLEKVPDPGASWSILFDEKYKQDITLLDSPSTVIGQALMVLGYSPYSTDPAQIEEATLKAIEQKPLIAKYDSMTQGKNIMDGYALVNCWDGDVVFALQGGTDPKSVRYVLPTEGYQTWMDGICIPTTAPSPYAAHLFLDHLMEPKVIGACASYTGYQPVIDEAMLYVKNPIQQHMRPSPELIAGGLVPTDVSATADVYEESYKRIMDA